ncbi:glycoprotein L [Phascolarctid gammaherpesvirus 1]|uniref:Glycoprotein L n=1 Tax=Phascolarctid gammaherpesvirus 1 TaxID=2249313 RepID=A0A3S5HA19_9GAMA|nr:glycoprotein L [Phascolarctid gammaherpesvirus 1]AZB49218.1 glycoprotein L [Phascolarctid gammaherpesvirus 1]
MRKLIPQIFRYVNIFIKWFLMVDDTVMVLKMVVPLLLAWLWSLWLVGSTPYRAPNHSYLGLAKGCCEVVYLNKSNLFRPWKYENIHFLGPDKCNNISMVSMYRFKFNKTRAFRCGNGFNVMSFFINLLSSVGNKRTTEEEELLGLLTRMKRVYLTTFSENKTNTSQFSGFVLASPRAAEPDLLTTLPITETEKGNTPAKESSRSNVRGDLGQLRLTVQGRSGIHNTSLPIPNLTVTQGNRRGRQAEARPKYGLDEKMTPSPTRPPDMMSIGHSHLTTSLAIDESSHE